MSSSDVQVQGSNDWSIASKLSTVSAGYYEDLFISCFVEKPIKRSSLIHRGYYVRAKAMSHIYESFLAKHPECQIISFGAGFDTTYFMLKHLGHNNCQYVEIDFPDVVKKKWQLIKNHPYCSELSSQTNNYLLLAADLRNPSALSNLLFENHLLNPSKPTLLISECAITYMDEVSSSKLIEWCANTFVNAVFAVYEQIRPTDGFGRVMQQHFIQLSIPLLSLPFYPDKESQRTRYLRKGWPFCEVYDINEFVQELIPSYEFERMKQLETFDEYEGFHEKCAHYIILTAAKGSCLSPLPIKKEVISRSFVDLKSWLIKTSSIQRYGQAGVSDRDRNGMWIVGGFGSRPQGHGRLDNLIFVNSEGSVDVQLTDKRLARMYHSLHLIQSHLVVYGGRTHPGLAFGDIGFIDRENNERMEWLEMVPNEWPEPRWRHASVQVHPSEVFIGGGCSTKKILSDCWMMRVNTQTKPPSVDWIRFQPLPSSRHSSSASYWNDRIIICGGLNESERACQPLMLVSPIKGQQWTEPPWTGPTPISRYSHQALVTSDNRLVLIGGVTTCHSYPPGVCVIDLQRWSCIEYSLPIQDVYLPVMLVNFNAQLVEEGSSTIKVRCWGGGSPCFSFGTHLNKVYVEIEI